MAEPATESGVGKERTIAFSDGVFAIAITLPILNHERVLGGLIRP